MKYKNSRFVVEQVTAYYADTMEEAVYAIAHPNKVKWENNFKVIDYDSDEDPKTTVHEIPGSEPKEQQNNEKDSISQEIEKIK